MADLKIERRTFLRGAALAALTATGILPSEAPAQAVPNSSGTERPKLKAPTQACDCHHHIYDTARFPAVQQP
jgi:D-galactarolactone isomerase